MPDTLSRIAGPTLLTAAAATVYTVPASTTVTLRSIHVANVTANAVAFTLSIGADAAGTRLYAALQIPANGALDWTGNIVLAATEILQAYGGTASALTLTVTAVVTT